MATDPQSSHMHDVKDGEFTEVPGNDDTYQPTSDAALALRPIILPRVPDNQEPKKGVMGEILAAFRNNEHESKIDSVGKSTIRRAYRMQMQKSLQAHMARDIGDGQEVLEQLPNRYPRESQAYKITRGIAAYVADHAESDFINEIEGWKADTDRYV